jgi:hypothetical protein
MANPIHSHAGRLIAFLVSNSLTTIETITFYDATSVPAPADNEILVMHVNPLRSPIYVQFPRDQAIPFSTGLCVACTNTALDVHIWSVDYG